MPPFLPVTLEDLGPASKRLAINPKMLVRKAENILRHFTDRISNTELRLQVNNSHGQDGVAFLTAIEQELNTPSSIRDTTATARYAMLLADRLPSPIGQGPIQLDARGT